MWMHGRPLVPVGAGRAWEWSHAWVPLIPAVGLEGGSLLRGTRPSGARGERTRVRARRAEESAATLRPAGRTQQRCCCPKAA